jgi:CofD-related protein of GAK system
VILLFSRLVLVRGVVRPSSSADLHLAAELEDGTRVIGQHRLTGKLVPPLRSRVVDLGLVRSLDVPESAETPLLAGNAERIRDADLICYPMGSFYSSVVANLLPKGVGAAVRSARAPKVYIPNTGTDPEQIGMSVGSAVETLASYVRRDTGEEVPLADILNLVLVDTQNGDYALPLDLERVRALGVEVADLELVTPRSRPDLDPGRLADALMSLA